MKANYNVTGNDRKALVAAIEKLTGDKAVYMRMPTCAYEIGDITVDKESSVTCEDADKLERIIHNLIADGFTPEDTEEVESDDEAAGLTVSLPLDKVAVGNLTNLLTAKERLIKKALGINNLGIEVTEDTVSFPWFTEMPEPDEVKAYTHFIAALGKMSRDLKRISATEKEVDNEKYAFRCFLLRLGFIGNEYKAERKILLKNLSGNSSWKNGAPEKEVAACELSRKSSLKRSAPATRQAPAWSFSIWTMCRLLLSAPREPLRESTIPAASW